MKVTVDIVKKIIYLPEEINFGEFEKVCKRLDVDQWWKIIPDNANYYYNFPTYEYNYDGTVPKPPWKPETTCY